MAEEKERGGGITGAGWLPGGGQRRLVFDGGQLGGGGRASPLSPSLHPGQRLSAPFSAVCLSDAHPGPWDGARVSVGVAAARLWLCLQDWGRGLTQAQSCCSPPVAPPLEGGGASVCSLESWWATTEMGG